MSWAVVVGVEIDGAGGYDAAAGVDLLGPGGGDPAAELGDSTVFDRQIGAETGYAGAINNGPAANYQVILSHNKTSGYSGFFQGFSQCLSIRGTSAQHRSFVNIFY